MELLVSFLSLNLTNNFVRKCWEYVEKAGRCSEVNAIKGLIVITSCILTSEQSHLNRLCPIHLIPIRYLIAE
jgi:hypothetical protein